MPRRDRPVSRVDPLPRPPQYLGLVVHMLVGGPLRKPDHVTIWSKIARARYRVTSEGRAVKCPPVWVRPHSLRRTARPGAWTKRARGSGPLAPEKEPDQSRERRAERMLSL